jgi:hypothetical protein
VRPPSSRQAHRQRPTRKANARVGARARVGLQGRPAAGPHPDPWVLSPAPKPIMERGGVLAPGAPVWPRGRVSRFVFKYTHPALPAPPPRRRLGYGAAARRKTYTQRKPPFPFLASRLRLRLSAFRGHTTAHGGVGAATTTPPPPPPPAAARWACWLFFTPVQGLPNRVVVRGVPCALRAARTACNGLTPTHYTYVPTYLPTYLPTNLPIG